VVIMSEIQKIVVPAANCFTAGIPGGGIRLVYIPSI
jgi:hypothetical protein